MKDTGLVAFARYQPSIITQPGNMLMCLAEHCYKQKENVLHSLDRAFLLGTISFLLVVGKYCEFETNMHATGMQ